MFSNWKRKRLTRQLRGREVELAGAQAELKAIETQVRLTGKMSIYQNDQMSKHARRIGELQATIAHEIRDLDELDGERRDSTRMMTAKD